MKTITAFAGIELSSHRAERNGRVKEVKSRSDKELKPFYFGEEYCILKFIQERIFE